MEGSVERSGDRITIRIDGEVADHAWIRTTNGHRPTADPDLALIALLLPAMRSGRRLRIAEPVSARLLASTDRIQDVFCTWDRFFRPVDRWYRRIDVEADVRTEPPERASRTLCLFTGGVDSFHTVLSRRDDVDALVFVHGFDVPLGDAALRRRVAGHLREAAAELDLPLLELESDLQDLGHRWHVGWPDYHGAALAAMGTALGDRFGRLLVPATKTYAHLEGLGSHVLLDPLWSGDRLEVEHVGAESTRVDKIRAIAGDPVARRHLRVCWENRDGAYNCGRCEKCVRTGVAIRLAGEEGRFPTIPSPSLRDIAGARVTALGSAWLELRYEVDRQNAPARLRLAIDLAIGRRGVLRGIEGVQLRRGARRRHDPNRVL